MSILNFLLYWTNRVYEWFGWLYESGRNAALYAWSWAVNQGQIAYNLAVNYAISKYNDAVRYAWDTARSIYDQANNFARSLFNNLIGLYNSIYGWVDARIVDLRNWVDAKTAPIFAWVGGAINDLSVWVFTEVNKIRDKILPIVQPFIDLFNQKIDTIEAEIENRFGWIVEKDSSGNTVLYTFLSNPMGFIMAFIWSRFSELLCFGLAYGFGSIKYELPPLPDWNSPGISGGYLPPSSGPPGESGLLSPLNKLYVSGYLFGSSHKGIDYGLQNNDPVYAMHDGEVLLTDVSASGYGIQVVLSGGAWWSRYAHLGSLSVIKGQRVKAGTVLGLGDSTGNSTGPHLHLEIKFNGGFIDPLTVL